MPYLLSPITPLPDLGLRSVVISARQDLLFFARCLAPLAGVVANSAPAAAAWYDLLNAKTLLGTGLPNHPWVGEAGISGSFVPTSRPVVRTRRGSLAPGQFGDMPGNADGPNLAESEGCGNHDEEAALFLAMASAANKDEWSAMLVGAGLVRSLVNGLQACLDFRTAVRGLDSTKASAAAGKSDSSVRGGSAKAGDVRGEVLSDGCLERELETAQVLVVVALGALLSAHPFAARDRFQLSGGMLRVNRAIFQQPMHFRGEGCNGAASLASPFLQEHCALVALQVVRLCLRADDEAKHLPPDVLEGAARLVGALAPLMRMTWEKSHVMGGGLAGGSFHVGLSDGGERFQQGGLERDDGCDRHSGLSHGFLPLGFLEEVPVPVPEARVASGVAEEAETGATASASASASASAGVPSLSERAGPASDTKPPLDVSSYRLCG